MNARIDMIRSALATSACGMRGDHTLNGLDAPDLEWREAAVLIALIVRDGDIRILLTKRAAHLNHHAGQVSFPGGRCELTDPGPHHTALREAYEETGLDPKRVEVIGTLDTYLTRTGFSVTPVVGVIQGDVDLKPDPSEVHEMFELPLESIFDPEALKQEARLFQGMTRFFYAISHEEWYIWGATAGMLKNLAEVINQKNLDAGSCTPKDAFPDNPGWPPPKPRG